MDDDHDADRTTTEEASTKRPRAVNWIWGPWYAKLYWTAATLYWSVFLLSWIWHLFPDFFRSIIGAYFGLAFHPVTGLVVLGSGFVRAFFSTSEWEWAEPTHEQMFNRRSITGLSDPYSDPADPRSGTNWVGSLRSRARYLGRKWP